MPQSKKYNTKKHMGIRMFNYKNQPRFDNVVFLGNQCNVFCLYLVMGRTSVCICSMFIIFCMEPIINYVDKKGGKGRKLSTILHKLKVYL